MPMLFDFDGTLVNSFHCVMKKAQLLAEEYSFRRIEEEEIEKLRHLSSVEIITFLKVPLYKVPILISKMRQHLRHEMANLKPIAGIPSLLEQLYNENGTMGIVTSNSLDNVEKWLEINQLRHFFNFIHTESRYFSKKQALKKIITKYHFDKSQTAYIGDETRDVDAAKKNNITSVAVTWGYNSEQALLKYEPAFVARTPGELLMLSRSMN